MQEIYLKEFSQFQMSELLVFHSHEILDWLETHIEFRDDESTIFAYTGLTGLTGKWKIQGIRGPIIIEDDAQAILFKLRFG